MNDPDGERFRPDVLVRLPEGRHIVIDAKVSLTAYERFCAAPDDATRGAHLAEHLSSVRGHVKALGDKSYANLAGVSSLDFVLLFVPIEAAFIEAVRHDDTLYDFALAKNIVIVCPSTLLATLRIVSNLWRIETQNRNAQLIAQKAGDLYDKFCGFAKDLDDVGRALGAAHEAHENAMSKLRSGKGNLVRKTEQLRKLGAKPSKKLPQALLDAAEARSGRRRRRGSRIGRNAARVTAVTRGAFPRARNRTTRARTARRCDLTERPAQQSELRCVDSRRIERAAVRLERVRDDLAPFVGRVGIRGKLAREPLRERRVVGMAPADELLGEHRVAARAQV
jgi:DNA anti-recombination protein RmuC